MLHTHSWLSTQEDVQITNHTARWSRLNWRLLSSPLPLYCNQIFIYIVIKSGSEATLGDHPAFTCSVCLHLPYHMATVSPCTMALCLETWLPVTPSYGLGLQWTLNFRLLLKQKLLKAGVTVKFLVSLMNITDTYDYITKYSTFNL